MDPDPFDELDLGDQDDIDQDTLELMLEYEIDQDTAERAQELIDDGFDDDDAVEIAQTE
jgi:hypothetical protein